MDFLTITKGTEPVSEKDGLAAFELLVPILLAAPDDQEAVEAAEKTIQRMPRESIATALLDWWFVITTAGSSPQGLAFHLPDTIQPPLRDSMEQMAQLAHSGLRVPASQWVCNALALQTRLEGLDEALDLETYGRSKMPEEREVWAFLLDELASTIDSLRGARPTRDLEFDSRDFDRRMRSTNIQEGSRRWNEMDKRAKLCTDYVSETVSIQALVEPWEPRKLPVMLEELPAAVTELGPIVNTLLSTVTTHGVDVDTGAGTVDDKAVAELLDLVCRDRTTAELSWLASIADSWLAKTRQKVDGLREVLDRRAQINDRIERLRSKQVDADEIEVMLLDHDLDEAEAQLDTIERDHKDAQRVRNVAASIERLRSSVDGSPPIEDWDVLLASAEQALALGDVDGAQRLQAELELTLRRSRRSESIEELEQIRAELQLLEAPQTLMSDLEDHLESLEIHPEKSPDSNLVKRSRERLESIRQQRTEEVDRKLQLAQDILANERDLIPSDSLPWIELALDEAEQLWRTEEIMEALDGVNQALDEINRQRVRSWLSSEGEGELVRHVIAYCTQQMHFEPDDIRRLYVAAKTKPFVILAGLTGSGKSTIARLFAAALGAHSRNGRFQRVAVRPDWIDQSEVLGTVNPLSNNFEPGWLATTARQCESNPDQIHVVLLDEMNLAPVEQYLAEYLSALEESRSGSDGTQLPLYSPGMTPGNNTEWPPSLTFPRNLIVIGTVNVDETTRVLSDRVLDRANVLQLSVRVSNAHHEVRPPSVQPWHVPFAEWNRVCAEEPDNSHHEFLVEIADLLQGIGIGVGQRAHIELERFVANADGILDPVRALDLGVLQRIIPKIRGFKRDLVEGLSDLHDLFESAGCDQSAAVIENWLDDRHSDDEFLDGTDARIGLLR